MRDVYLGIDLGTSAVKALAVRPDGSIAGEASESCAVSYPGKGMCEQSPADWIAAASRAVRSLGLGKGRVRGIATGGQMHGSVLLDGRGEVVRPCVLWNDGRAREETEYLNNAVGKDALVRMTGNVAFAGFTAPKLMWIKKHEPEAFARVRTIMLPKDYAVYALTGVMSTDLSDASGTLLFDTARGAWSEEMCRICSVGADMLPEARRSQEIVGYLTDGGAALLGLDSGIPVCAGAGDNAAAAIGTGTTGAGSCNISLGTSGTVFVCTDGYVPGGDTLHSFRHADGGYHLMGCMLSAASCNKWWTEDVCRTGYETAQSEMPEPGSAGVIFLPHLTGERSPHNDTDARSMFVGMRPHTTRGDMGLAVLEGVAFGLRGMLEAAGTEIKHTRICGGGARSGLWRRVTASVLRTAVETTATENGPAFGAALLAMTGCGEYGSVAEACASCVRAGGVTLPEAELADRYDEIYAVWKDIYPAMKRVFRDMRGI